MSPARRRVLSASLSGIERPRIRPGGDEPRRAERHCAAECGRAIGYPALRLRIRCKRGDCLVKHERPSSEDARVLQKWSRSRARYASMHAWHAARLGWGARRARAARGCSRLQRTRGESHAGSLLARSAGKRASRRQIDPRRTPAAHRAGGGPLPPRLRWGQSGVARHASHLFRISCRSLFPRNCPTPTSTAMATQ